MITAQEACTIAQGACLEELKYIKTAAEMHMMSCIIEEEISEAAKQVLRAAGYNVRVFSFHSGYITYINWGKGGVLNVDSKTGT